MGISQKALGADERIVIETRTHWKAMIGPAIVLIVVVAAAAFTVSLVPSGEYEGWLKLGIIGVAFVILAIWTIWPFLVWIAEAYAVTDQRLITRKGVITRTGRDIPLGRINDVSHERGLLDRILGCGTLVIWSAGEQGRIELYDIPNVEDVQRRISELLFQRDGVNDHPAGGDTR